MDNFTQDVLDKMTEYHNLGPSVQHHYRGSDKICFHIGTRERGEVNYAFTKTKDFVHNLAYLIEDIYLNQDKNCIESEARQILKYDNPFDFKLAPYFTLSPDGNQLRYWIGPYSGANYNHVDSNGKNLVFSLYQNTSAHIFLMNFCSKHSVVVPKYHD
jgi:hypothetical protein